eukprot:TRINITY_DN2315_c0_g1_i1.p1 TRINITY_DN2315_c0_g1~~TRINITY_DN2315_c0_g1_i1.p1  ORF type:complete len:69 (+),score=4.17 TRINITY_DN2315_c0_g1_i1:227-433(+)
MRTMKITAMLITRITKHLKQDCFYNSTHNKSFPIFSRNFISSAIYRKKRSDDLFLKILTTIWITCKGW